MIRESARGFIRIKELARKNRSTLVESMDACSCSDMDHPVIKTLEVK
jgi:hypothetical protein